MLTTLLDRADVLLDEMRQLQKGLMMNSDTLDNLDSALSEISGGQESFEPLIEAVGNDDDERIARDIYALLWCPKERMEERRNALLASFAAYFKIDDEAASDVINYREKAYGDFSPEREVKIA